jgi:glycerate kinase
VTPPRPLVFVVAPDSFKGSISAPDAAAAIGRGLALAAPDARVVLCPLADGGEGTLDAVLSRGGERRVARVRGAGGAPVDAAFGLVDLDGVRTAVLEVAQVVGITDAAGMSVPVARRSTEGVGEQLRHVLDLGVARVMIGLGGSSTNDGGAGLLAALGAVPVDRDGAPVAPTPEALPGAVRVDASRLDPRLAAVEITLMSDVNNPLCGERGATAIFGPQKGVRPDEVPVFDARLAAYAGLAESALGRSARHNPGAGAAGGLGFALQLIGARFRSGAEVVAALVGLDAALAGADLLVTGEGGTDRQTLLGKTPWVAAKHARDRGVPAVLLSGSIDRQSLPELRAHFDGCFSIVFGPATLADCTRDAAELLADSAAEIARVLTAPASRLALGRSR